MKSFRFKSVSLLALFLCLFLVSCSSQSGSDANKPENTRDEKKQENVLQGYQDQLQKAKDAEQQILDAAERQKKAIDDSQ